MVRRELTTVYEYAPSSDIGIDIVSIPGLPDLHPQYKLQNHERWLREDLSHQVPRSRILQFRYDFAFRTSKTNRVDWNQLEPIALSFLGYLSSLRSSAPDRPIIFVCYSFGAFIFKQALRVANTNDSAAYTSVFESVKGVLFVGCLNRTDLPDFENRVLACAAVEFRVDYGNDVIKSLRDSHKWDTMIDIVDSFKATTNRFPVRTFFEQQRTTYTIKPLAKFFKQKNTDFLCCEDASRLDWGSTEELVPVDTDHEGLLKLPSRTDDFFDKLIRNITDLTTAICPLPRPASEHWRRTSSQASTILASRVDSLSLGRDIPLAAKLPCHATGPHEKALDNFVGRKDVLDRLAKTLVVETGEASNQRVFALCGLGGMGKTQIAVSFVFAHLTKFRVILWAHADSRAKLAESFAYFAIELGIQEEGGSPQKLQADAQKLVLDWLKTSDETALIVFDNADSADNRDILDEFWPSGSKVSILITSRDSGLLGRYPEGTELGHMDPSDAAELLQRLTQRRRPSGVGNETKRANGEVALRLVKKLGYYPLGIRQASHLIVEENWKLSAFDTALSSPEQMEALMFNEAQDSKFVKSSGAQYRYSLATVWNMNWNRLSQAEKDMMCLMAFMDADKIQMSLFESQDNDESLLKDTKLGFMKTKSTLAVAKHKLEQSSLISEDPKTNDIIVHRLVQAYCQLKMGTTDRCEFFKLCVALVKARWPMPLPHDTHNPKHWEKHRNYLPHVQALCQTYDDAVKTDAPLISDTTIDWNFPELLFAAGWFSYESGLLASVTPLLKPAEKYCLQHVDKGGAKLLANIYGGLGAVDTVTNQFQAAFVNFHHHWDWIRKAIASGEIVLPDILEVFGLGRLGNAYHGMHQYAEAEKYYRQCLQVWTDKKLPGDQRLFQTHLATCLWLQGKLAEAEATVRPMIRDWEDRTTFRTGQALFALGNIEIAQAQELLAESEACDDKQERDRLSSEAGKRFEAAERTHRQSWLLIRDILGQSHHKTADYHYKIGWHCHRRRAYTEALKELKKAMDVYEQHPHLFKNEIARTGFKMGTVYQDTGDLRKGRELIDRAQKLRKELVAPEQWTKAQGESDFDELVQFLTR